MTTCFSPTAIASVGEYLDAVWLHGSRRGEPRAQSHDRVILIRVARTRRRGFPTGRKWDTVATRPVVATVVCNARRGNPARQRQNVAAPQPVSTRRGSGHRAFALAPSRHTSRARRAFEREIDAAHTRRRRDAGGRICTTAPSHRRWPEEYLFGEEKALLEVIEGCHRYRVCCRYEVGCRVGADSGWEAGLAEAALTTRSTLVNTSNACPTCRTSSREARIGSVRWGLRSHRERSLTVVGDVVRPGVAEVRARDTAGSGDSGLGGAVSTDRLVKARVLGRFEIAS